jgi:UDP-N-acetylglucosamine diphosphorylase/glucosamine-1-phosphate N-acetyltransferase
VTLRPALFLYDDAAARRFEPFSLSRPLSAVRVGALLMRERWEWALGSRATAVIAAPHLAKFTELDAPRVVAEEVLAAGTIVANARCAPSLSLAPEGDVWLCEGRIAAVRLREAMPAAAFADGALTLDTLAPASAQRREIAGWWLERPWHCIATLGAMLHADIPALGASMEPVGTAGFTTLGPFPLFVDREAHVEPLVVFDVTSGPILIGRGATVSAFTRLVGPCVIGEYSQVLGGKVVGCSIGEHCRVHGEMSTTILIGHANKGHDGFVGHTMLGRWSNLGASTVTSNLKNTYGNVTMWAPDGEQDTGMQFLGTLLGDHAKTAIGTRLTTGTVVGTGANVLADGLTPKD